MRLLYWITKNQPLANGMTKSNFDGLFRLGSVNTFVPETHHSVTHHSFDEIHALFTQSLI